MYFFTWSLEPLRPVAASPDQPLCESKSFLPLSVSPQTIHWGRLWRHRQRQEMVNFLFMIDSFIWKTNELLSHEWTGRETIHGSRRFANFQKLVNLLIRNLFKFQQAKERRLELPFELRKWRQLCRRILSLVLILHL